MMNLDFSLPQRGTVQFLRAYLLRKVNNVKTDPKGTYIFSQPLSFLQVKSAIINQPTQPPPLRRGSAYKFDGLSLQSYKERRNTASSVTESYSLACIWCSSSGYHRLTILSPAPSLFSKAPLGLPGRFGVPRASGNLTPGCPARTE